MIIVKFSGGLGNQMGQYIFFKQLETTFPEHKIFVDTSLYSLCDFHHGFELESVFSIKVLEAVDKDINKYSGHIALRKRNYLAKIIFRMAEFVKQNKTKNPNYLKQNQFQKFEDINLSKNENYYFDGVWLGMPWLRLPDKDIQDIFRFPTITSNLAAQIRDDLSSVSMHVRRGDYVGSDFDVLGQEYYKNSIEYISKKLQNPHLYIFSDDYQYIKDKFTFLSEFDCTFVDENTGQKSYKDMHLMSLCHHNIIANSTFSYWAALLNKKADKIVIAPGRYSKKSDGNQIVKDDWIIIEQFI